MGKYLFGTGIIGAVTSGVALLNELRDKAPFTWRTALAWLSWGISLVLAVGAIIDTSRATRGVAVAVDSPVAPKAEKLARKARRAG